jgi:hypothetical protein
MARTAYRRRPPGAVAAEVATHQSLWNLRPQYERAPAVRVGHGIPRRYFAGFSTFASLRPI